MKHFKTDVTAQPRVLFLRYNWIGNVHGKKSTPMDRENGYCGEVILQPKNATGREES